jgi:1-acyl-sn-glycerol-3-phosphate acyltransferase
VIAEVENQIQHGQGVIIFPEGTSTRGDRVLEFKSPFFEVAVRASLPVSYASISYETPAGYLSADEAICWWGDMTFLPHVLQMLTLPSFRATVAFGAEPIRADDRKTLANLAHHAVEECFTPVAGSCA